MVRIVNGQYERDESDVAVRVAHMSNDMAIVRAFLPVVEYSSFVKEVHESSVPSAKVERED
jgi:hypothetical protein